MVSPFPGMDPYLEGSMWSDVHHDLASAIRELIAPQIAPAYFARIERYTVRDTCLLYTSPSPRDRTRSRMPSSA